MTNAQPYNDNVALADEIRKLRMIETSVVGLLEGVIEGKRYINIEGAIITKLDVELFCFKATILIYL